MPIINGRTAHEQLKANVHAKNSVRRQIGGERIIGCLPRAVSDPLRLVRQVFNQKLLDMGFCSGYLLRHINLEWRQLSEGN
jgi:hypothetical protein